MERRELIRNQNMLNTGGIVLRFISAWTLLKVIMEMTLKRKEFLETVDRISPDLNYHQIVIIEFCIVVLVLAYVAIFWHVAKCVIHEARGIKKHKLTVVWLVLLLALEIYSLILEFNPTNATNKVDYFMELVTETVCTVTLIQTLRADLVIRRNTEFTR